MACSTYSITGQALPCKDSVTGVKEIYLIEEEFFTAYALSGDTMTVSGITLSGTNKFKTYKFPQDTATLVSTPTISKENTTMFYANQLTLPLYGFSSATKKEIHSLVIGNFVAIVRLNDNTYHILGQDNAVSAESGANTTGKVYGERSGGDIIISNKSQNPVYTVLSSIVPALIA